MTVASQERGTEAGPAGKLVWIVVPAALGVYLYTMAPVVGLIDSGELTVGCHLLNILHPTGYPLYTLIGRLASLVPVGSVVNRLAGLSAVMAAGGIGLFLLLLRRMEVGVAAAGSTAMVLAFSQPVWSVGVDVEVYALTLVLGTFVWLAAERAGTGRGLMLLGYAAGLALTNHMSGSSIVVGAGIAVLLEQRSLVRHRLWVLGLLFLFGLSPYLFLVLRARVGPLLAWSDPSDLERLWWHVSGAQYRGWMFTLPFSEVLRNTGSGLVLVARSFGYVLVPSVFYGAWRLWIRRRGLGVGLAAAAVLSFVYAVNYSIPDIEAYFIPCVLALAVFCGFGLQALADRLGRWRHVVWVLPAAMLALNFGVANRRDHYVAHDIASNVLASADSSAVVLTDWWDAYASALYLQQVEGVRTDVSVVYKELVRRRWYLDFLERQDPELMQNSREERDAFLLALEGSSPSGSQDRAGVQQAFIRLIHSFGKNSPGRPLYTTFARVMGEESAQMFPEAFWAPVGLLFLVHYDTAHVPGFDYSRFQVRLPARVDARTRENLDRYRFFAEIRARYLAQRGRQEEARRVVEWYRSEFTDLR
ncbi:MAG: DUF2723 domain-containing protein [candidate division WOR-3 bacterium]|nr:MAG: DUF2723 domain-containing protein [candidate division WOR-3 bacterium]